MKKALLKISLLLVALIMIFSIFACGDKEEQKKEDQPPVENVFITFEIGRGSFTDESFSGIAKTNKGTALASYPEVTRQGHVFLGWFFDEECTNPCPTSFKFQENTTLYADWGKTGLTITFNTNGGSFTDSSFKGTMSVNSGSALSSYPNVTRNGFNFTGWYFDSACTQKCEANTTFNGDRTLYAGWTSSIVADVTVNFNLNGGKFVDSSFDGFVELSKGDMIGALPEATKNGYEFKGWFFDSSCTIECFPEDVFDSSVTLYAGWTAVQGGGDNDGDDDDDDDDDTVRYTVRFDVSRANYGTKAPANQSLPLGAYVTLPDLVPERAGSTFYGWCVLQGTVETLWDFENDTVSGNLVLVAVFRMDEDPGAGDGDECEHDYQITEEVAPTCKSNGRIVYKCTICRMQKRVTHLDDPSLKRKEHLELEETVEPTCAVDGYTRIYCPNGCGSESTFVIKATGKHQYDPLAWSTVILPTKYVNGAQYNYCIVCSGAPMSRPEYYTAFEEDLENPDISFLYTGGQYVNERFVNVSSHGRVEVSSYYTSAKGANAIDGNALSFWNADTYADGCDYTKDWICLQFDKSYDIGALRFVIPNYSAWELGEDCYVSYAVEYWDESSSSWISLGTVSDKNSKPVGINCEVLLEFDSPVNTNMVRARVTHAGRYNPAVIYELETYAKTDFTQRYPVAVNTDVTASISGKYNEWVSGAGALTDNTTVTYWTTDARYNKSPWAMLEFSVDTYVACIQFSLGAVAGRTVKLEVYENGQWVTVDRVDENGNVLGSTFAVPKSGVTNNHVISNKDGVCVFNVDIERFISKIRLTFVVEPEYWTSYVYDITPYSIVERSDGEEDTKECKHENPLFDRTVDATCAEAGYTVMKCACGLEIRTGATDKLGHDFGKYTIDVPATATSLGTKVACCKNEGCVATNTVSYEENYDAPVITPYLHDAPAAWAQSFDDGNYLDTYTWANEYFEKYGYKATVVMSITYSDALVSTWQSHFARGVFDLGSHSYNHTTIYSGPVSEGDLLNEVIGAQYWFRHNFKGQQVLVFAAPLGATSDGVAEYLPGPMAANRNGGDTGIFYNLLENLTGRKVWGDLNSYISKADQTEGDYVFVKKDGSEIYVKDATGGYVLDGAYKNKGINLIFDYSQMTFVDKGYKHPGTYYYDSSSYKYEYRESGSYTFDGTSFTFVSGDSGEYKLVKATIGSYEKGVERLVSLGGFTIECLHSLGSGSIYSSYASTISKFEHMARFGVWGGSYNQVVQYLRESQSAQVQITERTENTIKLNVTDDLDDFMYNHALTIKVDIPDSWTSVTATQGGKEIDFVEYSYYKQSKNMSQISCAIDNGYLYIDVIPDGGEVVITVGGKDSSVNDYKDRVTVSFEPYEGELESDEYEAKVVVGEALDSLPTPERYGFYFKGWYTDVECTQAVDPSATYSEDATLYALWEEMAKCVDGSYEHSWGDWLPAGDNRDMRECLDCGTTEERFIAQPEE